MISSRSMSFFEKARKASMLGDYSSYKLGCVAVYNKKHVIGVGFNSNKTHPLQQEYNRMRDFKPTGKYTPATLHAEIHCLSKLNEFVDLDYSKVAVYVYRTRKNGERSMSRPCKACMEYIRNLGIKKVFYTTNEGFVEETLD